MSNESLHHRRSIRIPGYDYSGSGAYFITVVTHQRACVFGRIVDGSLQLSRQGGIAEECWRQIAAHFPSVELGVYVVMPNHVHGIIVLNDRADASSARRGTTWRAPTQDGRSLERFGRPRSGSLATIVRQYKSSVTRRIDEAIGGSRRVWKRNYYEHVIRDDEDWNRIHLYIESNAANWEGDEENPARPG